ncbi:MAG: hypothetical protein NVS3B26_28130 [Mycobacteriales bacterium]
MTFNVVEVDRCARDGLVGGVLLVAHLLLLRGWFTGAPTMPGASDRALCPGGREHCRLCDTSDNVDDNSAFVGRVAAPLFAFPLRREAVG